MEPLHLAVCQYHVTYDKRSNLQKAGAMIVQAAAMGADMVVLPECFNCPYELKFFTSFAEEYHHSESMDMVRKLAQTYHLWIVCGSIPEREGENLYNTSFVFDPNGNLAGKYRKVHLFDIDIPDKITFKESDIFKCGDEMTVITGALIPFGVAVCYDLRFPEWFRSMADRGAELIVLPSVFSPNTGPAHWELLLRARAVDYQIYIAGAAQAPNHLQGIKAYGHSMIVDPWGDILASCGEEEKVLVVQIDRNKVSTVRKQLPLQRNIRRDLYLPRDC